MLKVLKYPSPQAERFLKKLLERVEEYPKKIERYVEKIGLEVKKRGDLALLEYTSKFDGVILDKDDLRVDEKEIDSAYKKIDNKLLTAIRDSIQKVKSFHSKALPLSWFDFKATGITLGQVVRPLESAGLYIPGGKGGETPLISTVIMTAVPARLAGVKNIFLVSPPRKDKSLHPALLVAGKEAGVDAIFRIGGPWSIFALAYGTESIPKVEIICGPGNIYVTLAKKLVSFQVGIDFLAGPSEVLIIADDSADPEFVVWDLLAQAEHDPLSMSLLITTSRKLLKEVKGLIPQALSKGFRREIAEESLRKRGALIHVDSIDLAFELANLIAPEHLEIMTQNPFEYLSKVKNAGAVFLGAYTPEAIGDYMAGPNHVLPTMGLARFTSALSAEKFLKKINFMQYTPSALVAEAEKVITLATAENLPSHAEALKVRLKRRER